MADDYLTAEAKARYERIDPALREAGWVVQRFKEMNLNAAEAVAARERAMVAALREGKPIGDVMGASYETMLKK